MQIKQFKVLRTDRAAIEVEVGDIVYDCAMHDYGLANDDTRATGIEHVSVSLKEDGDYPFFTIPRQDLEQI